MKELNDIETQQVSGGIIGVLFAPFGGALGGIIGGIVDAGCRSAGYETNYTAAGALLGAGIAAAVGLAPLTATAGIGLGVVQIVQNARSVIEQKVPA